MYNFEDLEQTEENQKDIAKIENLIENGNCAVKVWFDFDYDGKCEEKENYASEADKKKIIDSESIKSVKLTTGSGTNSGLAVGAVLSNSLTATLDLPYKFAQFYYYNNLIGKKFQLRLKYEYIGSDQITYGELSKFTYNELSEMTVQEITDLKKINNSIPMGVFKIYEAKRTKIYKSGNFGADIYRAEYSIKACDALGECDVEYTPQSDFESSVDVENTICEYLGIDSKRVSKYIYRCKNKKIYKPKNSKSYCFQGFIFRFPHKPPDKTTMRQMLSYIASLQGKIAVINRQGELEYRWYDDSELELNSNTMSAIQTAENDIFYSGLECKIDDKTSLKSGDYKGKIMSFENPYMTQKMLDEIRKNILLDKLNRPKLKFRCTKISQILADPRLDNWDIVTAKNEVKESVKVPILRVDYTFNGGFSANIESEVK